MLSSIIREMSLPSMPRILDIYILQRIQNLAVTIVFLFLQNNFALH